MSKLILRLPDVCQKIGMKRSSIYAMQKQGDFPQSVRLGPRCVGWLESEIEEWLAERIRQSRLESATGN